ncbi:Peptidoglycan/LPS O-acetylase OafA/YrhL, contains acyltransferase and SGNH-hydrolase domains [Saccharopolyspora flava]|uniref:Peptidoglycan/LPS O-acetylase OafA/YrhL, contains acyltransferase and SGNH-hydrolase domains n=1 Tax=Saccharopolyspora flava TaxID=95161 RepID=A0A1I6S6V0_9PSEU|nr:Peptidoglycan/LPS O-acetylase OafA/YrhL, contains acyltransferase and SGNH-hydrolase domains [Saccharopolyspora flava]
MVLVMLYHSTSLSVFLHPELEPRAVEFPYQVGASLLLVVSAYFACVTIRRGTMLRYWWGRIARLLPSFLAAVVISYFVLRAFPIEGWFFPLPEDLRANLLMLWHWKPQDYPFIDGSHWTVPLQLMGFTAAALLYKSSWGHGRRMLIIMWVAVILPLLQWPIRINDPVESYRVVVDGIGMHRWHLFVAGVAIWMWSVNRLSTPHFATLLALCMAAQEVHNYTRTPEGLLADTGSSVAVAIGMCVIALVARSPDLPMPPLLARAVTWFAGISYGTFLMHQAIGYIVLRKLQDVGVDTITQTLAMLVTGTLLGWMLTRVVEKPAHELLMRPFTQRGSAHTRETKATGQR